MILLKKTAYDKLVAKVNSIDTIVLKTKYDTDKSELENKIPDTSGLVKKTECNAKIIDTLKVKFLILVILQQKLH